MDGVKPLLITFVNLKGLVKMAEDEEQVELTEEERLAKYRAVDCPYCHVEAGQSCVDPETGTEFPGYHRGRAIAALG
jgi:hypothetical protein